MLNDTYSKILSADHVLFKDKVQGKQKERWGDGLQGGEKQKALSVLGNTRL